MENRRFKYAIVRSPGQNFNEGLTTAELGEPDFETALSQYAAYCAALKQCGLELIALPADLRYPDSTFVEDVAVLTRHNGVLTWPGAESRRGEVAQMRPTLARFYPEMLQIRAPGTLDGGDVCEAGDHFLIGLSERTNPEGGRQLAEFLAAEGCTSSFIQVSGIPNILHLKSGLVYLGERTAVAIDAFAGLPELADYRVVRVSREEAYAANCLRVNDAVLIAAGFPGLQQALAGLGFNLLPLEMSEFQKMDGGLSCLSLRF
jgi:dimethylargininase